LNMTRIQWKDYLLKRAVYPALSTPAFTIISRIIISGSGNQ